MFSVRTLSNEGQSSYIPKGYSSLLFRFQGIHSGVTSPQGLADIRHLSSPLASIIPVTTNDCFSDVGFRNKKVFAGWGC